MTTSTIITAELANKFIASQGLTIAEGADPVQTAISISGAMKSQSAFAAFWINVHEGNTTPADLTSALAIAFPGDKVSDRHGAHFCSLSRTGKLKNCNFAVAKSQGSAKSNNDAATELAKYKRFFDELEGAKSMKEVRALVQTFNGGEATPTES